jgi:ribosomal protein S20
MNSKLLDTIQSADPKMIKKVREAVERHSPQSAPTAEQALFEPDEQLTNPGGSNQIACFLRKATQKLDEVETVANFFTGGLDKIERVLLLVVHRMGRFGLAMALLALFCAIACVLMLLVILRQEDILMNYQELKAQQSESHKQQTTLVESQKRVEEKVERAQDNIAEAQEQLDEMPKIAVVDDEKSSSSKPRLVLKAPKRKSVKHVPFPDSESPMPVAEPDEPVETVEIPLELPRKSR